MAQAQIALETRRARHAAWQRFASFLEHVRQRREARRLVARMVAERDAGHATGARV